MAKDFRTLEDSNRSSNPDIHTTSGPSRRTVLRLPLGAAVSALFSPLLAAAGEAPRGSTAAGEANVASTGAASRLGFRAIATSTADHVVVPAGYRTQVIAAWGEPVGVAGAMPPWRGDASESAAEQALQLGMHHDGLHYFPLDGSRRGLLVMNHEYVDDGLLHPDGTANWSAEKVRKAQAAHGLSVVEIVLDRGQWQLVRPSRFARRVTAATPITLSGPAAGHPLLCTAADPDGRTVLGTLNNCAAGMTPWGTYLSGEENFNAYFDAAPSPSAHEKRWGLTRKSGFRWAEHDERFDVSKHPNEPHRFGWIVELDPHDPASPPRKRTALGRAAHEGAWVAVTKSRRAVVYSGEDAAFEYIYKFVSRDAIAPAGKGLSAAQANATLLDHGTLYVARFDADGRGRWLPLVHGQGPLVAANGFADQAEVLVQARQASDALGATKMDRPEWLAIDPRHGDVYCTLTNNAARGAPGRPGTDAANPRAQNTMGSIIRWREDGDFDGETFRWHHFVLAGDPRNERPQAQGNIDGDAFACPDGLAFDTRGVLWVQTDAPAAYRAISEYARLGNNQMLACDVQTGEVRRFLTGPRHCEVTGLALTPDGRTMFVNIQHPGESPGERNDPDWPDRHSNWPDGRDGARPRSATVVVRRDDGGVVGG